MSFLGSENMAIHLSGMSVLVLYITSGFLVLLTGGMCFLGGPDSKESTCNVGDLCEEDPPEEGMATHSSSLAWRVPWTEEPGGLQFVGSQRIRRD